MNYVPPEYNRRHREIYKARGMAREQGCALCDNAAQEWAHTHGTDQDDVNNYRPLCIPCHRRYDQGGKPSHATGSKHTEEHKRSMLGNTRGQATWFKKKA